MGKIVLSGYQPTGKIHIGNYLGSLKNFVELQKKYECYFFIADYHSITENYEPGEKQSQIMDTAKTFLAAGLDPDKCSIFIQSHIPEVFELTWIFNSLTPISHLNRMIQYKDKALMQKENINVGLFDYPVLMAADILIHKADFVPVGDDQLQHLELTKSIARFFNKKFGQYFTEPKPLLTKTHRVMSLNDPAKKMSKILGEKSYIALTDEPETIISKISSAVTATTGGSEAAGVKNLFILLKEFSKKEIFEKFQNEENKKTIKYAELKTQLADDISEYFAEFRKNYKKLKDDEIKEILKQGAGKTRPIAQETLKEVKEKMGLL